MTNSDKNSEDKKHHHQTVRFLSNNENHKENVKATLAESEESIISKSSHEKYEYKYGFFENVRCGDLFTTFFPLPLSFYF